jgi:hypothetical protein
MSNSKIPITCPKITNFKLQKQHAHNPRKKHTKPQRSSNFTQMTTAHQQTKMGAQEAIKEERRRTGLK